MIKLRKLCGPEWKEPKTKHQSLVTKLRLISDSSTLNDERIITTCFTGWEEVARGWQPVNPYPIYMPNRGLRQTQKNTIEKTYNHELKFFKLFRKKEDIHALNNQPGKIRKTKKQKLNSDLIKSEKNRLEKIGEHQHHSSSSLFLPAVKKDNRSLLKKITDEKAENSFKVNNNDKNCSNIESDVAITIKRLPRLDKQLKNISTEFQAASSRNRTSDQSNQVKLVNLDYDNSNFLSRPSSKSVSNREPRFIKRKNRQTSRSFRQKNNVELKQEVVEGKSRMHLHVVLPSVSDSLTERNLSAVIQIKKVQENNIESKCDSSPILTKKIVESESENNVTENNESTYYNWKFLPFVPPVLKDNLISRSKWQGRKKPVSNIVAITQGTAKAGVNSNSIQKLQNYQLQMFPTSKELFLAGYPFQ